MKTNTTATGLTLVNPKKSFDVITSAFSNDADATKALGERIRAGEWGLPPADFPSDIYALAVSARGGLSEGRRFWLHKLATQGAGYVPVAVGEFDLTGVVTLLATAKQHLKHPALLLTTSNGVQAKVSLAGVKSKNPGNVYIASKEFRGPYYGRVATDGKFYPGRDYFGEVGDLLADLAKDPASAAAKQGHLTGACCFCGLPLSDERSTEVGYGKRCSENYGLQWGKAVSKAKPAPTQDRMLGIIPQPAKPAKKAGKPRRIIREA